MLNAPCGNLDVTGPTIDDALFGGNLYPITVGVHLDFFLPQNVDFIGLCRNLHFAFGRKQTNAFELGKQTDGFAEAAQEAAATADADVIARCESQLFASGNVVALFGGNGNAFRDEFNQKWHTDGISTKV